MSRLTTFLEFKSFLPDKSDEMDAVLKVTAP